MNPRACAFSAGAVVAPGRCDTALKRGKHIIAVTGENPC
jgi:hypothetical protein